MSKQIEKKPQTKRKYRVWLRPAAEQRSREKISVEVYANKGTEAKSIAEGLKPGYKAVMQWLVEK